MYLMVSKFHFLTALVPKNLAKNYIAMLSFIKKAKHLYTKFDT